MPDAATLLFCYAATLLFVFRFSKWRNLGLFVNLCLDIRALAVGVRATFQLLSHD